MQLFDIHQHPDAYIKVTDTILTAIQFCPSLEALHAQNIISQIQYRQFEGYRDEETDDKINEVYKILCQIWPEDWTPLGPNHLKSFDKIYFTIKS